MPRTVALKESSPPRPIYERHRPEKTLLYRIIDRYYPELLTYMVEQGKPLPHHVQKEFDVIGYNLKVAAESLLPGCDVSDQMMANTFRIGWSIWVFGCIRYTRQISGLLVICFVCEKY